MARKAPRAISSLSLRDLQREINKRVKRATSLRRKRGALMAKVDRLDAEIREIDALSKGGRGPGRRGGGKRFKNEMPLANVLANVLKGKTMGPSEAADAALAAGYQTGAANFRTIVNQTLLKHRKLYKQVSRGQYTLAK